MDLVGTGTRCLPRCSREDSGLGNDDGHGEEPAATYVFHPTLSSLGLVNGQILLRSHHRSVIEQNLLAIPLPGQLSTASEPLLAHFILSSTWFWRNELDACPTPERRVSDHVNTLTTSCSCIQHFDSTGDDPGHIPYCSSGLPLLNSAWPFCVERPAP